MVTVLDHVGIVVEDLEAAGRALETLFDVAPESLEIPEVGLQTLLFRVGGSAVEVLCFARAPHGIDPRVFEPGPGIQHLAFRVADLDEAQQSLEAAGVEVFRGFPRQGVHGRILFFAEPASGVLLELVEVGS